MSREEIVHATLTYVSLIIRNFYAYTGDLLEDEKLLQTPHPDALWERIRIFLGNLRGLPCWVDKNLSGTIFGAKQNRVFWLSAFKTGAAPGGSPTVLTTPIDLQKMIKASQNGVPDVKAVGR